MATSTQEIFELLEGIGAGAAAYATTPEECSAIVEALAAVAVAVTYDEPLADAMYRTATKLIPPAVADVPRTRTHPTNLSDECVDPRRTSFTALTRHVKALLKVLTDHGVAARSSDATHVYAATPNRLSKESLSILRSIALRPAMYAATLLEASALIRGFAAVALAQNSDRSLYESLENLSRLSVPHVIITDSEDILRGPKFSAGRIKIHDAAIEAVNRYGEEVIQFLADRGVPIDEPGVPE
jgi:hypothetical protein